MKQSKSIVNAEDPNTLSHSMIHPLTDSPLYSTNQHQSPHRSGIVTDGQGMTNWPAVMPFSARLPAQMPFRRHGGHSTMKPSFSPWCLVMLDFTTGKPIRHKEMNNASFPAQSNSWGPPDGSRPLEASLPAALLHHQMQPFWMASNLAFCKMVSWSHIICVIWVRLTGLLFLHGFVKGTHFCGWESWITTQSSFKILCVKLRGAKVVVEEHTEYPSRGPEHSVVWHAHMIQKQVVSGGDFADHFRTWLPATELSLLFWAWIKRWLPESFFVGPRPSSINQNLAPPISIDSFTPFQQFGPEFFTLWISDSKPFSFNLHEVEADNDIGGFASCRRFMVCQLFALLHLKGLW